MFTRLLQKVEEQRKAYGGKVFDVLGSAFDETPLRDLLIEAIRYGDLPETRARMQQVIDEKVANGVKELLEDRAGVAGEACCVRLLRRGLRRAAGRRAPPVRAQRGPRHDRARHRQFHGAWERFDESGEPTQPDGCNTAAKSMLDQLAWWATALRTARNERPYRA